MARPSTPRALIVDARPRGPDGPMARVPLLGRPLLTHLVELAFRVGGDPVVVHARADEHEELARLLEGTSHPAPVVFATGPPPEGALILRADRLYDPVRLRRAARRGRDAEAAAIWRLDTPHGLLGAEAELVRRRSYQPIGRFWSVGLAGLLVRLLAPTRVRPHALTIGSFALMIASAVLVLWGRLDAPVRWGTAAALAAALVLDGADGRLARKQGTASPIGRWLDTTLDESGEMLLHAAIAWAAFSRSGSAAWLAAGMTFAMGKYLFTISNDEWDRSLGLRDRNSGLARVPLDAEPRLASPTWWGRRLGHADVRWHLWIVAAAAGRLDWALAVYAAYFPTRALVGAIRKVGPIWRGAPASRP
ncbi:CDP-alcohol phosphatidyltransferase family protein [Tautonia sociabilis]|uniref:Bifunctional IPC transferase and DIPP synthase n=1 Tax=Tautonia sociabilis TaxID=2080755 RepID=A0A432MGZ9_9BACT|nr:CDP-alcohol phosphatidyltransferase family protein [Tautonia sociabilis]RUL86175.1 CDP-alcohol phosphatidyltransferase family protein [Tautonia sociabilis]